MISQHARKLRAARDTCEHTETSLARLAELTIPGAVCAAARGNRLGTVALEPFAHDRVGGTPGGPPKCR